MSYATIDDRVELLEALFGQFLTEMALMNKRADQRNKLAEERNKLAEERNKAAEERHKSSEKAAEERLARFEQEMREFKNEMRQSKRDLDKKWGDLANKMGTIIEDILAPNLSRLAREHFRFAEIIRFMIRCRQRHPERDGLESEFDTLVVGPDAVILGEAKSSPSLEKADEFAEKVRTFFEFFPEYQGKRLIAVLGSWSIPDPVVERLTSHRIYAMRMGEDTMELVNAAELEGGEKQ